MAVLQAPGAEPYQQRTLADIILEKIRQKQAGGAGAAPDADDGDECVLEPHVLALLEDWGRRSSHLFVR